MVVLSGCSVGKVVNQPKAKDLSVLDTGTSEIACCSSSASR